MLLARNDIARDIPGPAPLKVRATDGTAMTSQQRIADNEPDFIFEEPPSAPGLDALKAAFDKLYLGRQPRQFDNPQPRSLGGDDPLASICVWRRADPVPHWHFVTHGFSDLVTKTHRDPAVSGFGFELTLRVACQPDDIDPPIWPLHLLQSLGRYVFNSGNGFRDGHRVSTNGPITLGLPTRLGAVGFTADPELPPITTVHGSVAFLQIVGLTEDEERAATAWDTRKLLDELAPHLPLFITDLKRNSVLIRPDVQARVSAAIARDGSSNGIVFTDLLLVTQKKRFLRAPDVQLTLGARQIQQLVELLPLRLPFERPFMLCGPGWRLQFEPGRRNRMRIDGRQVTLQISKKTAQEFATLLHPRQGVYKLPSFQNILWDVKQTTIRNALGELVDIIG